MDEKIHLLLLVISLSLLHHEVQTQKANFCNITESYFVEVPKTETILGLKKVTGILGMFSGNKYENITRNVIGVEKRERVVEECCKGYKKKDAQCVPIDEAKSPKETTATTTTTAAPSSTSTSTTESPPASPSSKPVTQASTTEPAPSPEPATTQATEPVPSSEPSPQPVTTQASPTTPSDAPSESPVSTTIPEPVSSSTAAPILADFEPQASTSESIALAESSAASDLVSEPKSTSEASQDEVPAVQSTETKAPPQIDSTAVSESTALNEPMLSYLVVTTNTVPVSIRQISTPAVNSYYNSESATLIETTSSKQSEKLSSQNTTNTMDLTTIINLRRRRRRSLDELSNAVDSIKILEDDLSESLEDSIEQAVSAHKGDFNSDKKPVLAKKKHGHSPDSESIVVSDLTADSEDQGYPWIEILEVLSFGAVVFLLVVTVQASFDSETLSLWRANSKIPQEIDSYGEFWVYDSQGNLQEV